MKKQDILIYGAGVFFNKNKETLQKQYNIKAIIDGVSQHVGRYII